MAGTQEHESAVDRIRRRVEEKPARRAVAAEAAEATPTDKPVAGATAQSAPGRQQHTPDRPPSDAPGEETLPGVRATAPTEIPWRGWKQIVKRAWAENKADNMPIIGGGVAFFGFLAIFPALIALISIYGLVASPNTVAKQVDSFASGLPKSAQGLISDQLKSIVDNSGSA